MDLQLQGKVALVTGKLFTRSEMQRHQELGHALELHYLNSQGSRRIHDGCYDTHGLRRWTRSEGRGALVRLVFSMMAMAAVLSTFPVHAQGVLLPDYATANQGMVSAQDLTNAVAGMRKAIGNNAIAVQPVVSGDGARAALEYWRKPLPPAVHTGEIEYVTVIEGEARVIYGGKLSAPREVRSGQLQGDEILGGISRDLHRGDVLLIPSGMPHWFGPGPDGIVMLGIKFAPPVAKKAP